MLIRVATIGYGREPDFEPSAPDEPAMAQRIAYALRTDPVFRAAAVAEGIDPTDEELVEALRPAAERDGSDPVEVVATLRANDRLDQLRDDVAGRQALERLVESAVAVSVADAEAAQEAQEARDSLWTPEKEAAEGSSEGSSGELWTPGS